MAYSKRVSKETTLILFKPDAVGGGFVGKALSRFEEAGLKIRGMKMLRFEDALLKEHYAHIASKPFFPEVQKFMQRTPVIALALAGENAISRVRDLLGPTDSKKAAKGRDVFVYFDNDVKVQAPYDAMKLAHRLGLGPKPGDVPAADSVSEVPRVNWPRYGGGKKRGAGG